jgi:hypothetical protein
MSNPKIIKIDETEYVRADSVKQEVVNFTGDETIASRMIGKKVIVRSRNEGVNAGIVVLADQYGVELKDVRRLFYHRPKDESVSWYEGVAISGISDDSKVSPTVPTKIIIEDYSMTLCLDEAFDSIFKLKPNEQS